MKKHTPILIFFFFAAALYVLPGIFRPLMAPDEFRYAEIPYEMLESGDWVVPRLLGGRYFEKPPLFYWLTASAFKLFGTGALALRSVSILSALLCALLCGFWLRKTERSSQAGFYGTLLYMWGSIVIAMGNTATTDSLLALCNAGALAGFFFGSEARGRKRILPLFFAGIALAGGFLTKGFIAFAVPALSVTAYLLWQKRWKDFLVLPWLPLAVCAALILPWARAIHRAEPDFWHYFFFVEHIQRFSNSQPGQHSKPFWFLLPFFLLGLLPGVLPVAFSCWKKSRSAWGELLKKPLMRFALCATGMTLLFFSLSDGKLPTYILPAFAPAALAGALILENSAGEPSSEKALGILNLVLGIVCIAAGGIILLGSGIYLFSPLAQKISIPLEFALWMPLLTAAGAAALLTGGVLVLLVRRSKTSVLHFFMAPALIMAASSSFFPDFTANFKMPEVELKQLAALIRDRYQDPRPVVVTYPFIVHAAAWCFREIENVRLIDKPGELQYAHESAVAKGEQPFCLKSAQWKQYIHNAFRRHGVLILDQKKELPELGRYFTGGLYLSVGGELGGWYFPVAQSVEKKRK